MATENGSRSQDLPIRRREQVDLAPPAAARATRATLRARPPRRRRAAAPAGTAGCRWPARRSRRPVPAQAMIRRRRPPGGQPLRLGAAELDDRTWAPSGRVHAGLGTTSEHHEQGEGIGFEDDPAEQARRGFVHGVGIFEDEGRRARDEDPQELCGAVLETRPPKPGLELVDLAGRRHGHVDDVGEQREKRLEVRQGSPSRPSKLGRRRRRWEYRRRARASRRKMRRNGR